MQLHRFDSNQFDSIVAFCDRAEPFLRRAEVAHNLLLRVCQSLRDPNSHLTPSYLAIVEVEAAPVAVSLRTPPFPLLISKVQHSGAIARLATDLYAIDSTLPGINAPEAEALVFTQHWHNLSRKVPSLHMALRVHQLTQVQLPTTPAGHLRSATVRDHDRLIDWYTAFQQEALAEPAPLEQAVTWVTRQLASGGLYFWQVGGRPVSVACGVPVSERLGAINFVYTPPCDRRQGYASACVAQVSQQLLDQGHTYCALFTDLGNPTTNRIYQAIGYQPVCDWHHYHFKELNPPTSTL